MREKERERSGSGGKTQRERERSGSGGKIQREKERERSRSGGKTQRERERESSPSIVGVFMHSGFESSSTCRVSFSTRKTTE